MNVRTLYVAWASRPCIRRHGRDAHATGGFTLIELITVMVIICIVLAMAAPSLQGWSRGSKLRDAGDQFLAVARYAQAQSVSEARIYRLQVDAKAGRYWLLAQDGPDLVELGTDFGHPFSIPEDFRLEMTDLNG